MITLAAQEGWGDDEADAAPLNRDFNAARYAELPLSARRNLARVDEVCLPASDQSYVC